GAGGGARQGGRGSSRGAPEDERGAFAEILEAPRLGEDGQRGPKIHRASRHADAHVAPSWPADRLSQAQQRAGAVRLRSDRGRSPLRVDNASIRSTSRTRRTSHEGSHAVPVV